ncbi:MAG: hypothetical protein ACE5JS_15215 [Nitrospinota bacterium]
MKARANRKNAQKSTGQKTPKGKATVRYNALRRGILAKEADERRVRPPAHQHRLLKKYETKPKDGGKEIQCVPRGRRGAFEARCVPRAACRPEITGGREVTDLKPPVAFLSLTPRDRINMRGFYEVRL